MGGELNATDLLKLEYQHNAERKFDGQLTSDKALAVHEAAHAVVGLVLGVPLLEVRMDEPGGGGVAEFEGHRADIDGPDASRQVAAAGVVFVQRIGELPAELSAKKDFDSYADENGYLPSDLLIELNEILDRPSVRSAIFATAAELMRLRILSGSHVESIARVFGVRTLDVRSDARRALAEGRLTIHLVDKQDDRVAATFRTERGPVIRLGKAGKAGWRCDCEQEPDQGLCVHLIALQMITTEGPLGIER